MDGAINTTVVTSDGADNWWVYLVVGVESAPAAAAKQDQATQLPSPGR
jgi:hypothetical protein